MTIAELIPAINARYSLNLTEVDYVDGPFPEINVEGGDPPYEFDLVAGPNSLLFRNKVTLTLYRNMDA